MYLVEQVNRRLGEFMREVVSTKIGIEVTGNTIVRSCINAIGSYINSDLVVALEVIVLGCWHADGSISGENNNSGMVGAHTDFVLGTDHAVRFYTTEFSFLDGESLVAVIKGSAEGGDDDLLASCHIGSTTNDLCDDVSGFVLCAECAVGIGYPLCVTKIHGGDVHMVGVGMYVACKYLSDDKTLETAADRFDLLDTFCLKTDGSKGCRSLLGCEVELQIVFQPLVGNVHRIYLVFIAYYALKIARKYTHYLSCNKKIGHNFWQITSDL